MLIEYEGSECQPVAVPIRGNTGEGQALLAGTRDGKGFVVLVFGVSYEGNTADYSAGFTGSLDFYNPTGELAITARFIESQLQDVGKLADLHRSPGLLAGSPLAAALTRFPRLRTFQMPEARVVRVEGRSFCWTSIEEEGYITLPEATLREYEVVPGDRLLTVRGSGLALGFALMGPLVDEALTHAEIEVFE